MKIVRTLICLASLMILCCFTTYSTFGQNKSQLNDRQILQDLLNEVRLLRQTLQNVNLYAHRGQILVERIRTQQDRVTRLSSTIDNIRVEIGNLELQGPQLQDRVTELNEKVGKETDTKLRGELENEQRGIKQALSLGKQREEDLRKQETQLTAKLSEEQAKLDELENRLEKLERELERLIEKQKN